MKYGVYRHTEGKVTMTACGKLGSNFEKDSTWIKVAETRTVKEAKAIVNQYGWVVLN